MGLPQPSMEREVFILDDDPDVRETLRTMLEIGGYTVVCFSDSTGLLETVRRRCPVCILLDVNLPGRSGLEVLKDLRNYPVPVLMIRGRGYPDGGRRGAGRCAGFHSKALQSRGHSGPA